MDTNISSAINSAVGGIQRAVGSFNVSAQKIADGTGDLATELVKTMEDETVVAANGATLRTSDEMMKELVSMGNSRRSAF